MVRTNLNEFKTHASQDLAANPRVEQVLACEVVRNEPNLHQQACIETMLQVLAWNKFSHVGWPAANLMYSKTHASQRLLSLLQTHRRFPLPLLAMASIADRMIAARALRN